MRRIIAIAILAGIGILATGCAVQKTKFTDVNGASFETVSYLGPFTNASAGSGNFSYDWTGTSAKVRAGQTAKDIDSANQVTALDLLIQGAVKAGAAAAAAGSQ